MHIANLSVADALDSLRTSEAGLDTAEAQKRLLEYGGNRIDDIDMEPRWRQLAREFTHFFALILWVAAALAFFAESRSPGEGMWQLGIAIVAVIVINGVFSFWQEFRAERAVAALRKLLPQQVKTMRDGELRTLPATALVPGDILLIGEGDNVPADCRLIAGADIRMNISALTGESLPRARNADRVTTQAPLDNKNLLLAGTSVISGQGRAVVYATGMRTEFGRIARLTQAAEKCPSHLQQEIARLSKLVALLATAIGLVFFAIGTLIGLPFWTSLMFAIGIIVANVPEGLLPTVTLALAMATQRMAKRNAVVRHLPAVETLGATTVICSDKTGTLTQNRMSVKRAFFDGRLLDGDAPAGFRHATQLLRNARNCHALKRVQGEQGKVWLGDPMEKALVEFADGIGSIDDIGEIRAAAQTGQLPFDSERRRMSVVVDIDGTRWLYCKGAPEVVLPICSHVERTEQEGAAAALEDRQRRQCVEAQEAMAAAGLRVLAFAFRRLEPDETPREQGLTLSGLIGLHDPPRPEVPEAIARCHSAGIKVIMVTGDHPHTALAIARDIGLVRGDHPRIIPGEDLRRMTAAQLQIALDAREILFARVTAEQKMLVVDALKSKNEIVAVTGDGVNDAPALKSAHIGIAMGISGTDVARAAADMILLDDNFASIVNAIEEGRAVFQNIRKFLTYILTSNIPELIPYLAFVLFRIPLPLTVIQILAVDLGTDMLPALALGAEPPDSGLMRQPPRRTGERLMTWGLLARAYLWLGLLEAALSMGAFFFVLHLSGWHYGEMPGRNDPLYLQATTACLAAIVVAQMANVFVCRHPVEAARRFSLAQNPLLLLGLGIEAAIILLIVYAPPANRIFATQAFRPEIWALLALSALAFGALEEMRKYLVRRWHQSQNQPFNELGNDRLSG